MVKASSTAGQSSDSTLSENQKKPENNCLIPGIPIQEKRVQAMCIVLRIRGWKAITVLLIFSGLWVFRQISMRATLDTQAIEALKPWIIGRFCEDALREVRNRPLEKMSQQERESLSQKLLAANRVEIKSIKTRSLGEQVVVRVEVLVDGGPPPDGKTVRFYSMNYSTVFGWTFQQEVGPLSYWLIF